MKVELEHVTKRFGDIVAVDDVSLTAEEGELTTLVGPSGCGKTTTLRCISGLERPDEGVITIGGDVMEDPEEKVFIPPQKRDIGFVFQSFDVWPHLSVFENVAFPLEVRGMDKGTIEEKVITSLKMANIEELRDKNASELSGGQQARVSLSRSLVYEPKILLFDEPLTGLDRNLRKKMRTEIRSLQQDLGITSIYVTHSQPEAMELSDKICLMRDGSVEQVGSPSEIYHDPATQYAFEFIGSSEVFTIEHDQGQTIAAGLGQIEISGSVSDTTNTIGVRPENISISNERDPDWGTNVWGGTLTDFSFHGEYTQYYVDIDGRLVRSVEYYKRDDLNLGDSVYIHIPPEDIFIFE